MFNTEGGVQQYILSVGAALDALGHENIIAFHQNPQNATSETEWPTYHVDEHLDAWVQIKAIVKTERPDVAFIHHASAPNIVEATTTLLPTVAYVHGFQAVCPGLGKFFRRGDTICEQSANWSCFLMHYARRCSPARNPQNIRRAIWRARELKEALQTVPRIFVATKYMKSLLEQNAFDTRFTSILAPHFVSKEAAIPFCLPESPYNILFAGRLEVEKGFPYLLEAFSWLPDRFRLFIAGDGSLRVSYEKMVRELDLADRIEFLGWQKGETLARLYQYCSLLVMPSIWPEPFGKVGVEALMWGRPVIAFAAGGISDWLQDGLNGFLVEPKNTQVLADRIAYLALQEKKRIDMGRTGQEMILSEYTLERHMSTLLNAFRYVQQMYSSGGITL